MSWILVFSGTEPRTRGNYYERITEAFILMQKLSLGADVAELSPHYDPSGVSQPLLKSH